MGRGNFQAGVDLYDADILFIQEPDFPEADRFLGKDSIRENMRAFLKAWRDVSIAAEEFLEAGDSVVVATRLQGVGADSGAPVELRRFHVWSFRGRAAIRFEIVRDRATALEAVGLSE